MTAAAPAPTPLQIRSLRKAYGDVVAVNGLDLEVRPGECFGLLGPNGAGKTTTVEICEGLTDPDSGEVVVLGRQWGNHDRELRELLGISLQETQFSEKLTVDETVRLFRSFYRRGPAPADVIAMVQLQEKAKGRVGQLSGGQKQRLALACALVGDPQLLFLDEPTTGLDPQSRRQLWELIERFKAEGRSILLTTHYMDEAQRLADRVAVIVAGEIVREGSPADLTRESPETEIRYRRNGEEILERTTRPTERLHELTADALARGEPLEHLEVRRPTLEDVYLELTSE
jgi:ABC-2 type transport system ATP-binding protein